MKVYPHEKREGGGESLSHAEGIEGAQKVVG